MVPPARVIYISTPTVLLASLCAPHLKLGPSCSGRLVNLPSQLFDDSSEVGMERLPGPEQHSQSRTM